MQIPLVPRARREVDPKVPQPEGYSTSGFGADRRLAPADSRSMDPSEPSLKPAWSNTKFAPLVKPSDTGFSRPAAGACRSARRWARNASGEALWQHPRQRVLRS